MAKKIKPGKTGKSPFDPYTVTPTRVKTLLGVVDKGLCTGIGEGKPGEMCVEAAVCYAFGEDPNSDQPKCVRADFRDAKISINDDFMWDSDKDRARGLRRLAIVQLGTAKLKGFTFKRIIHDVIDNVVERVFSGDLKDATPKEKTLWLDRLQRIQKEREGQYDGDSFGVSDLEEIFYDAHAACEAIVQACVRAKLPAVKYLKLAPYNPPKGTPAI